MVYMHPLMVVSMHHLIFIFWGRKDKSCDNKFLFSLIISSKIEAYCFPSTDFPENQSKLPFFPSELNALQLLLISCTWGHTAAAISLFVFIFIHSENKRSERRKSSTEEWNWFGMPTWSVVIGEVLKPAKTAKRVEAFVKAQCEKCEKRQKKPCLADSCHNTFMVISVCVVCWLWPWHKIMCANTNILSGGKASVWVTSVVSLPLPTNIPAMLFNSSGISYIENSNIFIN